MTAVDTVTLRPIGVVRNAILAPQDDHWGQVDSVLVFDTSQFSEEAFAGIEAFSHLEIIFLMHLVDPADVPFGARRPRNLAHLPPVGIFAQRPKARPNRLGLSCCQLLQRDGTELLVRGLDAIDGTPILDIKPYFSQFAPRGPVRQAAWTDAITANYY